MINLIIWFAALICHNPLHTPAHHGNCNLIHLSNASTLDDEEDTGIGGETGGTHKPPIPPPPPPSGGN